ncbi:nucleotide pyrophosphohydrolase [Candidatus Woesearchaeota archaeon]|nr:nucleotide pyrophosphohydrolase [Candidatus Woesearchaeota archaeon]
MKESFEELIDIAKRNRKYSPWIKERTSEEYIKEVLSEVNELMQAIEKGDNKNIQEELGDVFWDTLMLTIIAEEEGKVNAKQVIKGVIEKMKRRKPFILDGKEVTTEEEKRVWFEAKEKEKTLK